MNDRSLDSGLRILGIAVCLALVLLGPAVENLPLRIALQIVGAVMLVQLSIEEGRARERRNSSR